MRALFVFVDGGFMFTAPGKGRNQKKSGREQKKKNKEEIVIKRDDIEDTEEVGLIRDPGTEEGSRVSYFK